MSLSTLQFYIMILRLQSNVFNSFLSPVNDSFFIFLVFIFLIGLCFGSFANVCIYRLPKSKQTLSGRSYCPKCKKKIKWFDNIPVLSYFLLNGKCRSCKKKISSQYFIVELITGLGFLLIFLNYHNHLASILLSILLLMYVMIFFIDLKHFIIPDSLNFGIIIFDILSDKKMDNKMKILIAIFFIYSLFMKDDSYHLFHKYFL